MADRDPWERPDPSGPAVGEVTRDPWEATPAAAAAPLPEWDAGTEAMNAAMLGGGPTVNGAIAAITGGDYAKTKAANEAAHQAYAAANPKASLAANLIGGIAPAMAATVAGAPVLATGAVMGAMPGVFNQDPTQTIEGGALGLAGSAGAKLLGKAASLFRTAPPTAPAVPTSAQALDIGGNQFDALRDTGVNFPVGDVRGSAVNGAAKLDAAGKFDMPAGAPNAHSLFRRMGQLGTPEGPPQAQFTDTGMSPVAAPGTPAVPVGIAELDAMRKAFGNVRPSGSVGMTDVTAARQGTNAILDLFAHNPQVADLSASARGNYGAGMQARELEDLAENAANGAQATGTGKNIGNKYRQAAGQAIKSDDFDGTPDVRAALQQTNDGTFLQNRARSVGTLLGGGGGPLSLLAPAMAAMAAGHEAAGPAGLLAGAVPLMIGHGAKALDNHMAKSAFNNAVQTALKRSPAYAENVANFVPPAAGGIGSVFGNALAPAIGAATANPGLGALFGN